MKRSAQVLAALLFERFDVLEELGSGSFGRVLRCRDEQTQTEVALKVLHRFGADALLRFKKEFRALVDVRHPNLVRFGELYEGSGHWALSMEYVPGTDFLRWLSPHHGGGLDEVRLRDGLAQLVHGLNGLHALGMLHRDVKPENVRVTPEGRVVLLDFGLVTHLQLGKQTSAASGVGTVGYMAPEQASQERLGPAADWYALGVLLYEALTHRLPFEGSAIDIMLQKSRETPPLPSSIAEGVPKDLEALCMGLLAPKPEQRFGGERVLAVLEERAGRSLRAPAVDTRSGEIFVGRKAALASLRTALHHTLRGGLQLVLVEGESGIGKSTLVQRFAHEVAGEGNGPLIFRGRCHESEQVGYKAFDGAVDELAHYLRTLSDDACRALLPDDAELLPVLFPVLGGVRPLAHVRRDRVERIDRYPMFRAFRELLVRLARARPVVLLIDDLQWADDASVLLLKSLLDNPRSPHVLIVATVRPIRSLDDVTADALGYLAHHARASVLPLSGLAPEEARELAARLVRSPRESELVSIVAAESRGHPMFVNELVRHAEREDAGDARLVDLDAAIMRRVEALDVSARLSLELSCIAGTPIPSQTLRVGVGAHPGAHHESVRTLRAEKLLRPVGRDEVVVYHDRIREAVLRGLDASTVASHHRKLASAFEHHGHAEPAQIALHWLACREEARAAPWLEKAALKAHGSGAFERAAEHYASLLSLHESAVGAKQRSDFRLALSDALASAGRCAESARVLIAALEASSDLDVPELSIRAAQRLLQAGEVNEGLAAARAAFARLDMPWPRSSAFAVGRMLYNRARIAIDGFDVSPDTASTATPEQLVQLDAVRRLVVPTVWADLLRSAELSSRHARLSIVAREPTHLAFALCSEASMRAMQVTSPETTRALFERSAKLRASHPSVELEAYETYCRGIVAVVEGDQTHAETQLERAEMLYRTACPGAVWELTNARSVLLTVWLVRGRFRQHAEHAQAWIDEATLRGDRFALATYAVSGLGCLRHHVRGEPDEAEAEIERAMAPWRNEGFGIQHFMEVLARAALVNVRSGAGGDVFWSTHWPRLSKSFVYRMPFMRATTVSSRLWTLLARAALDPSQAVLSEARGLLAMVSRIRTPFAEAIGPYHGAQLAWLEGDRARALALSSRARERFATMGYFYSHYADILHARAEGSPRAELAERELLERMAGEGIGDPYSVLFGWLPVARTWQ